MAAQAGPRKFGTFQAVFVPTLLTILGVIMYLRLPWVVGNVGLVGAWFIIGIAFLITTATALSMSSITTNIRMGAGGAYSIISQSLGLEVGGSLGMSFYLSQAMAVALYVFGFREGLAWVLPAVHPFLLDILTFALVLFIVLRSTQFAFRVQYVILAIIVASLVSVFGTAVTGTWTAPALSIDIDPASNSFWVVFAVFFPAATGIMAGANMSGELKDPRRSIPLGTLAAIAVSLVIYLALAYWSAGAGTAADLTGNFTIIIDRSLWGPIVLGGLLAATFSSALNSLVGSSRILQALGEHHIVPRGAWFAKRSASGEPRNAVLFTAAIALGGLMLRDLNAIAPLITMFFLITYATINVVILLEQSLGLVSFRPLIRVHWIIPVLGTAGSIFAMFIINPTFSLVALSLIVLFYYYLMHRHLHSPYGDVRSGLFVAIAEWAAKKAKSLPYPYEHAWKANLLVPAVRAPELRGEFQFLRDITYPRGSVSILGLARRGTMNPLADRVADLAQAFRDEGVFATWAVKESEAFGPGVVSSMQTLRGAFFRPNNVFLTVRREPLRKEDLELILEKGRENRMGVLLFANHPSAGLGRRHAINLWIPDQGPEWDLDRGPLPFDLALLIGYKVQMNWEARLRLVTTAKEEKERMQAAGYLRDLAARARLPYPEIHVGVGVRQGDPNVAPQADLSVFVLPEKPSLAEIWNAVEGTRSACLFARDSEEENAIV